jgi:hypothetical protein
MMDYRATLSAPNEGIRAAMARQGWLSAFPFS